MLVDLSGYNPNVCLELGMADAIGRDTLLIGVEGTAEQAAGRSIRELEQLRDGYLVAVQQALKQFNIGAGATLNALESRLYNAAAANALRLIGPDPQNWVADRSGVDHNVVLVGGGQTGSALAFALRRAGIGKRRDTLHCRPGGG